MLQLQEAVFVFTYEVMYLNEVEI